MFERCAEMCVDIAAAPGSIPDYEFKPAFDRGSNVWRAAEPGFAFNKPPEVLAMQFQRHAR